MMLVVLHHAIDLARLAMSNAGHPPLQGPATYVVTFFYQLGIFAVPLFLFVSGAFMAYAARGNPPTLGWKVVGNGLRRMIWPYVIWSLLFYVLVYFHYDESATLLGYAKHLLTGYPFHFIPLLIFFYVLSPVLVWFSNRFGLKGSILLLVLLAVYQVILLNLQVPRTLGVRFPDWLQILYLPVLGGTLAQWAIYFPLGLFYSLHARRINPVLQRGRYLLGALILIFFGIGYLYEMRLVQGPVLPLAIFFASLPLMLSTPLLPRNKIPRVKEFELIGKRSYGLYLMHLIAIDLTLVLLEWLLPGFIGYPLLLMPLLFVVGVGLPMWIMEKAARWKGIRPLYPYIFG